MESAGDLRRSEQGIKRRKFPQLKTAMHSVDLVQFKCNEEVKMSEM